MFNEFASDSTNCTILTWCTASIKAYFQEVKFKDYEFSMWKQERDRAQRSFRSKNKWMIGYKFKTNSISIVYVQNSPYVNKVPPINMNEMMLE